MEPRDLARRLLDLMVDFVEAVPEPPGPLNPLAVMLGGGSSSVVDPSKDEELRACGVGSVTPMIERIGLLGYVGGVAPVATGWLVFAPSERFYEQLSASEPATLSASVLKALFPVDLQPPTTASVAVAKLREELAGLVVETDRELVDVVLGELETVCQLDCRHAAIALCGKLLELSLGSLLLSWNRPLPARASLSVLVDTVRSFASSAGPSTPAREQARAIRALGLDGVADLVRTVRNGAVHVQRYSEGGAVVPLPSWEQAEAVVLFTVDLMRRFVLRDARP